MAIITPMKIRSAVILVKIPYTGPSCIPFIHCLAFDDFSYKFCVLRVSEGHDYHAHNAISVFLVCIPSSSATFGSKEILPVSLYINALINGPNISRRKAFVLSDRLCRFSVVTTTENSLFHDQYLSLKLSKTSLTNSLQTSRRVAHIVNVDLMWLRSPLTLKDACLLKIRQFIDTLISS